MQEPEAKQIVKNVLDRNPYEVWRRLHFTFDPQTATVETTAMAKILYPKQAQTVKKLLDKIHRWDARLHRFTELTGETPVNDRTRKELIIQMCPPQHDDGQYLPQHRLQLRQLLSSRTPRPIHIATPRLALGRRRA